MGWAIRNGASLGLGFTSRLGFWIWYLIPASSFLLGEPLLGAALYGLYGAVRSIAVWLFLKPPSFWTPGDDLDAWIQMQYPIMRRITAESLIAIGVFVVLVIGF